MSNRSEIIRWANPIGRILFAKLQFKIQVSTFKLKKQLTSVVDGASVVVVLK